MRGPQVGSGRGVYEVAVAWAAGTVALDCSARTRGTAWRRSWWKEVSFERCDEPAKVLGSLSDVGRAPGRQLSGGMETLETKSDAASSISWIQNVVQL